MIKSTDLVYIERTVSGKQVQYQVPWGKIVSKDPQVRSSDFLIVERDLTYYKMDLGTYWNYGHLKLKKTDLIMVERDGVLYNSPLVFIDPDNWVRLKAGPGAVLKFYLSSIGLTTIEDSVGRTVKMGSGGNVWYGDPYQDIIINFSRGTVSKISFRNSTEFEIDPDFDLSRMGPTALDGMFSESDFNGSGVETWDVSKFTTTHYMFRYCKLFNADLSAWNTSNITDMYGMFNRAESFNGAVGTWDTRNVTNMGWMFNHARKFDRPLSNWNTENVTNMYAMFDNNESFNQPLAHFSMTNVTNTGYMFSGVNMNRFNHDIRGWDVSNVTFMEGMFKMADQFYYDLSGWCVTKVPVKPANWAIPHLTKFGPATHLHPKWGTCP